MATDLGNTEPGDGRRFKGRGPIQITGRANYRRFGGLLSVDLVSEPARAAVPDVAFRIAGLFWSRNGLNELADRATSDAFRQITKRINGGFNGLADRQKFYGVACTVLGVTVPPVARGTARPPVPRETEEPTFDRGHEAIRTHLRRPRVDKVASPRHKTKADRDATGQRRTKKTRPIRDTAPSRKSSGARKGEAVGASKRQKAARPRSSRRKR